MDNSSRRQCVIEEALPIAATALRLIGEFGYSTAATARLLAVTGFIRVETSHEYPDDASALDVLQKALKRARR